MSLDTLQTLSMDTLITYVQGDLTAEQAENVRRMLARDPEKQRQLSELMHAHAQVARDHAGLDVSRRVYDTIAAEARAQRRRRVVRQLSAAAAAAALVGFVVTRDGMPRTARGALAMLRGEVTAQVKTLRFDAEGKMLEQRASEVSYREERVGDASFRWVRIPGGEFVMGTPEGEAGRQAREGPAHPVKVSGFYMSQHEITRAQWKAIAQTEPVSIPLAPDPSVAKDDWNQPVENITWAEAVEFCERLSKVTGSHYRLPSEAEWEYAARAGSTSPFAFGATITTDVVNFNGIPYGRARRGQNRGKTIAVGSLAVANEFGLFDMHGNVWEWTQDAATSNYQGAPRDGTSVQQHGATQRIIRGSSYYNGASQARSGARLGVDAAEPVHDIGFRVVRELDGGAKQS